MTELPDDIAAAIDAALSAANDYGRTFTVQALHREEAVRAALEAAILGRLSGVDELASYRDKITITFERRPDGGLRVYSDELPGLVLSHADHAAVLADLRPAIEGLLAERLSAAGREALADEKG